jgi:PPOX class probable F420-dependent enzyme
MPSLTPESIETALDTWPVARLASVGADGAPHQVPVVFARAGELLWSPVDAKPKAPRELVRVRNVRADPRVSLLLDGYDADWTRLWWLRVDAEAHVAHPPEPGLSAAVAALRLKYPQYQEIAVLRDPPTLLALRPLRLASWCAREGAASFSRG